MDLEKIVSKYRLKQEIKKSGITDETLGLRLYFKEKRYFVSDITGKNIISLSETNALHLGLLLVERYTSNDRIEGFFNEKRQAISSNIGNLRRTNLRLIIDTYDAIKSFGQSAAFSGYYIGNLSDLTSGIEKELELPVYYDTLNNKLAENENMKEGFRLRLDKSACYVIDILRDGEVKKSLSLTPIEGEYVRNTTKNEGFLLEKEASRMYSRQPGHSKDTKHIRIKKKHTAIAQNLNGLNKKLGQYGIEFNFYKSREVNFIYLNEKPSIDKIKARLSS